jgi:hypothetical protein
VDRRHPAAFVNNTVIKVESLSYSIFMKRNHLKNYQTRVANPTFEKDLI